MTEIITSLEELEINMYLGVSAKERQKQQLVRISFYLHQQILPNVTIDDNANDYLCYNKISQIIHDYCANKEFRTIEFLCYQIYQLIKKAVPTKVRVRIILEKCKPAMSFAVGSAKCEYGDLGRK
jgi:FolB domain-containing protein